MLWLLRNNKQCDGFLDEYTYESIDENDIFGGNFFISNLEDGNMTKYKKWVSQDRNEKYIISNLKDNDGEVHLSYGYHLFHNPTSGLFHALPLWSGEQILFQ